MTLELVLLVAAALFSVGLYGALSQQFVVMVMMGLELMLNGVILAVAAFWWFLAPDPSGQVLLLVVIGAMTVEMAMGFAVATTLHRSSGSRHDRHGHGADAVTADAALLALVALPASSARACALVGDPTPGGPRRGRRVPRRRRASSSCSRPSSPSGRSAVSAAFLAGAPFGCAGRRAGRAVRADHRCGGPAGARVRGRRPRRGPRCPGGSEAGSTA